MNCALVNSRCRLQKSGIVHSSAKIARGFLAEPNGDLFMLSTFTDAWTTDSTYFQIDKIPAFLIGLIENKRVSPQIVLYPNPTTDWVRLEIGNQKLTRIEVYSQQGQLLQQVNQPETPEINLSTLPSGIYIVVATFNEGKGISTLVRRE